MRAEDDAQAPRRLRQQPQWRERSQQDQLRRWLGSAAQRKVRHAEVLPGAVPLAPLSRPLRSVLAAARARQLAGGRGGVYGFVRDQPRSPDSGGNRDRPALPSTDMPQPLRTRRTCTRTGAA